MKYNTYFKDCVVVVGSHLDAPVLAASNALGTGLSKIRARLLAFKATHNNPWLGFSLSFPFPDKQTANEEAEFGVRYSRKFNHLPQELSKILTVLLVDRTLAGGTGVVQAKWHTRGDDRSRYYIIVALTKEFLERFDAAWRRLAKDGEVRLSFQSEDEDPGHSHIWYDPRSTNAVQQSANHEQGLHDRGPSECDRCARCRSSGEAHELVLSGRRPDTVEGKNFKAKTFATRAMANEQWKAGATH